MPYIKYQRRCELSRDEQYDGVATPGELNYKITKEIIQYQKNKGLSYQTINDIIGALEGAKLEFYRRVVAPYENDKIEQNGDCY